MSMLRFLRSGRGSKAIRYVLMSLLLLAMGGLVFTDAGGFFRKGISRNDVANIDGEKISIITFDNTLRRNLSGSQITPQIAYQFGLINQMVNQEIQTTLLKQAAEESGIELSKKELGQAIYESLQNVLSPGESTEEALNKLLQNWNLSEQRFIKIIERDAKATYVRNTLTSGFSALPESMFKDLYSYENEKRDVEIISFPNKDMKDFEKPTEERIANYYDANQEQFTTPESRDFKIIKLAVEPLRKDITISEDEAKTIYEEDKNLYTIPEKRTIEQAIYAKETEAQAAYQKIQDGTSYKEATTDATTHIEPTQQSRDEITSGLTEDIFSLEKGETSAPIQSPLGWHIVKINKITPAIIQPYKEVKDAILKELKESKLADALDIQATQLDDLIASGMTPEEIQKEIPVTIENYTNISIGNDDKLAPYPKKAEKIINSAFELFEGEASPLTEAGNGDLIAIYLTKITESSPKPLEEVKADITKTLTALNQKQANEKHVEELLITIDQDNASLDTLARKENKYLQKQKDLVRKGEQKEPLTTQSIVQIFGAKVGTIISAQTPDGFALIKITNSKLADPNKATEEELSAIEEKTLKQTRNEAYSLFLESERADKTIAVNEALLQSTYGSKAQ